MNSYQYLFCPILLCLLFLGCTGKSCILATKNYQITFPDYWKVVSTGERSVLAGPKGEEVFLTSFSVPKECAGESLAAARGNLLDELKKKMQFTAEHPDLVILSELKERELSSGNIVLQVLSESREGDTFHSQFGVLGPRNSILISMEGPIEAIASNGLVNKCLMDIEWK